MADKNQDVNLRIRATDYSKKTTDDVVKSLKELVKAQDAQIKSAEEGTAVAKDLAKSYDDIENAAKALLGQRALLEFFEKQNEALQDAEKRLDAARAAQTKFTNTLDTSKKITKEQRDEMTRLATAVRNAERQQTAIQKSIAGTAEKLEKMGIGAGQAAVAQAKINAAVLEANIALERQENAMNGLSAAQAQRQRMLDDEAQAERQRAADIVFSNAQRVASEKRVAQALAESATMGPTRAEAEAAHQRQIAEINTRIKLAQQINAETQARQAQTRAMLAAADAAERAARASAGAARGGSVTAAPADLAGRIQDIQQPSTAALRSVSGLETSIANLQRRVSEINGPIRDYRNTLREANAAQQALSNMAGMIDNFRNQTAAVRAARAEYVQARDNVRALVEALRSGNAGDDITQRLASSQSALRAAANNLGNLTVQARQSQQALREAGVNTAQLAQAEQQLVSQATRATEAMNGLTAAYARNGAAVERSAGALGGWFSGGRNTLSMAQRLRGEVLSLTSSFLGLFAALQGAESVIDSYNKRQALMSRLLVSTGGDVKAAGKEFEYVRAQANRFGFEIDEVGGAYSRFAIAAKSAGLNTQQTRFTFEGIATAARSARISTADFTGVMRAVEQMLNKSKIQSEELVHQFGDRLPGALEAAAKDMRITKERLLQLMEAGQVPATNVIGIARELAKTFGVIDQSAFNLLEAQARFQNATSDFKNAIADAGAAQAYGDFLKKLTGMISGPDGAVLAGKLADGFKALLDIVVKLIDNLDTILMLFKTMIALKVITWAFDAAKAIGALRVAFVLLNREIYAMTGTAVVKFIAAIGIGAGAAAGPVGIFTAGLGLLRVAVMALVRSIPLLLGAWAAIEIGTAVWDKFFGKDDEIRKKAEDKGKIAGEGFMKGVGDATADPGNIDPSGRALVALQDQMFELEQDQAKRMRELRKNGAKDSLSELKKLAREEVDAKLKQYADEVKDKQLVEIAKLQIGDRYRAAEEIATVEYNQRQAKEAEEAAKKRIELEHSVFDAISKARTDLAAKLARSDDTIPFADRMEASVAKARNSFKEMEDGIAKLKAMGGKGAGLAGVFEAQLPFLKDQASEVAERVAKTQELTRLEQKMSELVSVRTAKETEIAELVKQNAISEDEAARRRSELYAELQPKIQAAGNDAVKFAESIKDLLDPAKYEQALARLRTSMAQNGEQALQNANNLQNAERRVNDLLAQRDRQIRVIDAMENAGLLRGKEADEARQKVFNNYKEQIETQVQSVIALIEQIEATSKVASKELEDLKAKMQEVLITTNANRQAMTRLDRAIEDSIVNNGVKAADEFASALADVVTRQKSISEGYKSMAAAAGMFFSQVLRDIGQLIIKEEILAAVRGGSSIGGGGGGGGGGGIMGFFKMLGSSSFGTGVGDFISSIFDFFGGGSWLSSMLMATGLHRGGVVGSQTPTFSRGVSPSLFSGAPRFHNGGLPGLKADEVPAILQRGEEVVTRDDPRNVLNGGTSGGAGGLRFVLVDDRSKVPEAMASAEGETVIMQTLRRNLPTVKSMLGNK